MTGLNKKPTAESAAFVLLIVVIGLNLRPFLAAPGPILSKIADGTGLSYGALSLLTLLPMMLMGIGAFVSPSTQAALGTKRGLLLALGILLLGNALRQFAQNATILITTAVLCGVGVAFIQSIIPGLIKENFPARITAMTGLYSAMIMVGGALGAQFVPALVNNGQAWTTALALLALPVLITFIAASFILTKSKVTRPAKGLVVRLLRRPRTWTLMAVFGLINGGYSSLIAWLAPYYQEQGLSIKKSAILVSTMAISQGCGAMLVPFLARHSNDYRLWLWASIAMQAIGFSGLVFAPLTLPAAWVAICGVGLAGTFALCLVVALDHFPDPKRAGPLAALMQGGGFIIAAIPPLILARIHEATESFMGGWVLHLCCVTLAAILISRFNPKRYLQVMG